MYIFRQTRPSGQKEYITKSAGGYSTCVVGKETVPNANALANCVGYACGRFNEIIGSMKYPNLNCNAENFIERAISLGLSVVKQPVPGGIMVWQKGNTLSGSDGAGHVEVVEWINEDGSVYTSSSGYGTTVDKSFWNSTRRNANGRWGMSASYKYRGCIVNPAVDDLTLEPTPTPKPEPTPQPTVDLLDLVKKTIRGDFGNGEARKQALGSNYVEVQRQVNLNLQHGLTRWDNIKLF